MMKKLLILFLGFLGVLTGCINSGETNSQTPVQFSRSSLKGQYTYRLVGLLYTTSAQVPYAEAGIFTADGNGNITIGTDDFVQSGAALFTTSTSGTYSIVDDGTGYIILNNTAFGTITLAVKLVSSSKLYIIEEDNANTYGVAELQDSSTLSTMPSGAFAFKIHDRATASRVGAFAVSNGAVTGSEDILAEGVLDNNTGNPLTLIGSLQPPSSGRGSGSFSDGASSVQFEYYIVNANNIRILRTDSGPVSLGRAEAQSGGPFSNVSFSGSYAFGSRADDAATVNGVNTVGEISGDGNGNISGGVYDSVQDGTAYSGISIGPGTYSVSSNGRSLLNFATAISSRVQQTFWMVSPSRAFFLSNDPNKEEDGIADLQQSGTFSNTSLTGPYAFVMDGLIIGSYNVDGLGWIQGDGAGNMTWNQGVNDGGVFSSTSGTLSGTYSVASNGRVTATISGVSQADNDLVFYMISNSSAYFSQNVSGYEMLGTMDLQ